MTADREAGGQEARIGLQAGVSVVCDPRDFTGASEGDQGLLHFAALRQPEPFDEVLAFIRLIRASTRSG